MAEIAEGFSIDISPLIQNVSSEELKAKYEAETNWNDETEFGPKVLSGPGYILLKITENGEEITANNPGYIKVRK